jgi:hypothetical protein
MADPEAYKQHLLQDIQLIERAKMQKLELIKLLEAQARDLEDEYLEKSLSRFGNVFNGWNQIRPGGSGVTQGFGMVSLNTLSSSKTAAAR